MTGFWGWRVPDPEPPMHNNVGSFYFIQRRVAETMDRANNTSGAGASSTGAATRAPSGAATFIEYGAMAFGN